MLNVSEASHLRPVRAAERNRYKFTVLVIIIPQAVNPAI